MKLKIKQELSSCKYKGHHIRRVVTEVGCDIVLIDNDSDEWESSPLSMQTNEYIYASIADAKRFINGEEMKWLVGGVEVLGEKYWRRFSKDN